MIEPKLRFRADDGSKFPDLIIAKLENLCDKIGDGLHGTPTYSKTGTYYFINGNNLENGKIIVSLDTPKVDDSVFERNNKELNDATILMSINGTIGKVAYYNDEKVMLGKSVAYFKVNYKYSKEYYYQLIQTGNVQYQFKMGLTGSTIKNLGLNTIKNTSVNVPSLPEQQKIADFLSTIDTVISNYNDTIKAWEDRKKGVMQKLFSQEVRFIADDGSEFSEWEEKNVEDVCSVSTGKGNTQDKVDTGAYRFYVRSPIIEHSDSYLFDEEAVITVGDGVGTGKVFHYVKGKYNLHQRCYRMYDFRGVTGKYFYYFFSTNFYRRVKSMSAKTSVDSVRMEMITKMKISVPCLAEQQKIADCLSSLDKVIEKQKATLAAWEELKKGLLQQMFV